MRVRISFRPVPDGQRRGTGPRARCRGNNPASTRRLLDHHLYRSYFWPNWDRGLRIRHTTVAAFVERGLDREGFPRITRRDDVFALLVELATLSFGGRRYLKSVGDRLALDDNQQDRLRVIKRALR